MNTKRIKQLSVNTYMKFGVLLLGVLLLGLFICEGFFRQEAEEQTYEKSGYEKQVIPGFYSKEHTNKAIDDIMINVWGNCDMCKETVEANTKRVNSALVYLREQ